MMLNAKKFKEFIEYLNSLDYRKFIIVNSKEELLNWLKTFEEIASYHPNPSNAYKLSTTDYSWISKTQHKVLSFVKSYPILLEIKTTNVYDLEKIAEDELEFILIRDQRGYIIKGFEVCVASVNINFKTISKFISTNEPISDIADVENYKAKLLKM